MSELGKRIAIVALTAVVVAIVLAGGLNYLSQPQPQKTTSATITSSTTSQNTISNATATSTTSLSSTYTESVTSVTRPGPVLYTNKTVPLDPNLKIESVQSVLSSYNATLIAERLAYALGEQPVTAVVGGDVAGGYNDFKTAKGSWINITKGDTPLYPQIEIFYYRWDWTPSSPTAWEQPEPQYATSSVPFPNFNHTVAVERSQQIMSVLGVPANYINLTESHGYIYSTPSAINWNQGSFGTPFGGTMLKIFGYGHDFYWFHGGSFAFEFHPPDMRLLRVTIMGSLWYRIPSSFPLKIDAQKAIDIATDYAKNTLKMEGIYPKPSPDLMEPVVFVVAQDCLYYLVTLTNPSGGYQIFVNPRTGEVGIPTITSTITFPETTTLETTTTSVEENLTQPNLISSNEAVNTVMKFKGWNTTQISSYAVFSELRYLKEENGWLNIYTVDPNTTKILNFEASLSLQIPDPVARLRGYYWYVDVNVNPKTVAPGQFPEAGTYYNFWVDAVNATIAYSEGPVP